MGNGSESERVTKLTVRVAAAQGLILGIHDRWLECKTL